MSLINQNFTPLFKKGEKLEIYGQKRFNFYVLVAILTFTFCSIGGANLALKNLENKMSDPFVNLLSVDVPISKRNTIEDLKLKLLAQNLRQEYQYSNITNYVEFPLAFIGPENTKWVKGRSIDLNNPLLEKLLDEDNLISGSGFKFENEIGLIISRRLLDEIGYKSNPTHLMMKFNDLPVPIPIRAIVKELPELNYFVASPFFFFQRTQLGGTSFDIRENNKLNLFLSDRSKSAEFKNKLSSFFKTHPRYKNWDAEILQRNNDQTYQPGVQYSVEFFGFRASGAADYDELVTKLFEEFPEYEFVRIYDFDYNNYPSDFRIDTDKIAINFTSLDKVRAFQYFLFNEYQIEVDIARVRDKENFAFVKILTETISTLLIVFSIVSICFYLYNLLRSHLDKIRPNLGTFLAFGLDQSNLYKLYRDLLFRFLTEAAFISIAGSFLLLFIINYTFGDMENYVALFDWKLFATILILYGAFNWIFRNTIRKLLSRTPGDLIYDRK